MSEMLPGSPEYMAHIRSMRGKSKAGKKKKAGVRELRKTIKQLTKIVGKQGKMIEKHAKHLAKQKGGRSIIKAAQSAKKSVASSGMKKGRQPGRVKPTQTRKRKK